jgi:GntR family transcriptional regulator
VRPLEPPYIRIAGVIRHEITEGSRLPGEQLPSLDALAAAHAVARSTIQKAVRLLIDEGYLVTRPRWGTFVAERDNWPSG